MVVPSAMDWRTPTKTSRESYAVPGFSRSKQRVAEPRGCTNMCRHRRISKSTNSRTLSKLANDLSLFVPMHWQILNKSNAVNMHLGSCVETQSFAWTRLSSKTFNDTMQVTHIKKDAGMR